jgi:hypothetical protein
MHPKSRSASISERLEQISNEQGFEAAQKLVNERRLGKSQQEADAWLQWKLVQRTGGTQS